MVVKVEDRRRLAVWALFLIVSLMANKRDGNVASLALTRPCWDKCYVSSAEHWEGWDYKDYDRTLDLKREIKAK